MISSLLNKDFEFRKNPRKSSQYVINMSSKSIKSVGINSDLIAFFTTKATMKYKIGHISYCDSIHL